MNHENIATQKFLRNLLLTRKFSDLQYVRDDSGSAERQLNT